MGLNDLTLEKLIGEINGYKLKMQTLYEDYGRAAQDLQDRINVLGYNLNEQLKDVKDSISSTPQRLLTLETKYVGGEVGEQEYRLQRGEFKSLLQHNLHTIEDIKSMINVLSTIEARPLGPAEIRQATSSVQSQPPTLTQSIPSSLTPRAYGPTAQEDRNRPNSFPERPTYVAQLPVQQQPVQEGPSPAPWTPPQSTPVVSTFPFADQSRKTEELKAQQTPSSWQPETSSPAPVSTIEQAPSPTPSEPTPIQPIEATQPISEPTSTLAPATPAEENVVTTLTQESPAPIEPLLVPQPKIEQPIETKQVETTPPVVLETDTSPETPVLDTSPLTITTPEQSVPLETPEVTTPTIREPESPATVNIDAAMLTSADDALMVKVVDDIPVVDASAAVVTGSEAQLQSPLVGGGVSTEAIVTAPAGADVAQVSPSQPNAFYNVVCPKCGADVRQPAKVWELKGGKSKKNVLIGLFQCQDCRVKFREALTREII